MRSRSLDHANSRELDMDQKNMKMYDIVETVKRLQEQRERLNRSREAAQRAREQIKKQRQFNIKVDRSDATASF